MLLCGFEKFNNFYVRIDILERLFMQIINSHTKYKHEIKMVPDMINLLGCNKENFKRLLEIMNYKISVKNDDVYFKYQPKRNDKKTSTKKLEKKALLKFLKIFNLIKNYVF